ncbi:MAG TPA: VOC family protein [Candidatus Saccharimonadales bacterium]|nr:VOC family protein [Candidatus Saccharimonadales bacterium]
MAIIKLEPYIFFHGQAKEAMEFYKSIFGGELTIQTYEQAGQGGEPDWVMHATLEGDVKLMASDTEKASDTAKKISLSLGGEEADSDELHAIFDKLAEGGEVFQKLEKQFWGDVFGSLTDKYGVEWMMNIAGAKQE